MYLVSVASKREPLEWKRAGTKLVVAGGSKVVNSELFYHTTVSISGRVLEGDISIFGR